MTDALVAELLRAISSTHELQGELTGGGMSRVFRARELALKRDVVVKVLPPELVSNESSARFQREIEVTARLHHPHILPVLSAGTAEHLLYYFTPWVPGESLREQLRAGPMGVDTAIALVAELLDAVAFAHAQGIVHRDIKPGNVLVSDGHAILADFGIARALDAADDGRNPSGSSLVGALAYRAPESARGAPADLFSVAVMLHEMLLGAPGVAGARAEPMAAALRERHPSLGLRQCQALARAIAQGLDPQPERRPRDAAAFGQAIVSASRPAVAPRRYVALAAAVSVTALVAALAMFPGSHVPTPAPAASRTADATPTQVPATQSLAASGPDAAIAVPMSRPTTPPDAKVALRDSAASARSAGDLSEASRLYEALEAVQPNDPHAALGAALMAAWSGDPSRTEAMRAAATRALKHRTSLTAQEVALAEGVNALGDQRYDDACRAFERARAQGGDAFDAWFGLGECLAGDDLVLPADSTGPVRFRSSYAAAARAYLAAVRAAGPTAPSFAYRRFDRVVYVQPNRVRRGRGPDGSVWFARPEVDGDTIAFRPFDPRERRPPPEASDAARALAAARKFLRPLYVEWARVSPGQLAPHEALADLLESEGTISAPGADGLTALASNARALALAATAGDSVRLRRDRVRLLVRAGEFSAAGSLADSMVAANPHPEANDAIQLVGPAALSGRLNEAIALLQQLSARPDRAVRLPDGRVADLPPAVLNERAAFVMRAAAGVCNDDVRTAPERIKAMLAAYMPADGAPRGLDQALFERPMGTALACFGLAGAVVAQGAITPPMLAAQALARGDTARARGMLGSMDARRNAAPGAADTPELLAAEVAVRLALGDSAGASKIIARTLDLLPVVPATFVEQETSAATLVRMMAQLAELANASGNRVQARRWASAVIALWPHPANELKPLTDRMRAIVAANG
jgi:serine/threonine-protein kinase